MFLRIAIGLMVAVIVYAQGIKPIIGDYYYTKKDLARAIEWSPDDSMYHFAANNTVLAIERNNGDLTQYSLWCNLAIKLAQQGNREAATQAITRALWYYPDFEASKKVMEALKN